ncbi:hypothetical protein Efla_002691 [Eimeria flavescens]
MRALRGQLSFSILSEAPAYRRQWLVVCQQLQQQQQPPQRLQQQQQQQQELQQQQQQQLKRAQGRSCFGCVSAGSSSSSGCCCFCCSSNSSASVSRRGCRCFSSSDSSSDSSSSSSNSSSSSSGITSGDGCFCLKCKAPFTGTRILCLSCGGVLPALYSSGRPVSAFAIFEIPQTFDLNLPVVFARYKKLQQKLHPDKLINASPEEICSCEEHSRQVATALKILSDPAKRAEHLLSLQGRYHGSDADDRVVEPEILLAVMQIHEQLDGCKTREEVDNLTK